MDLDSSDASYGTCGRSCSAGQTCCNQSSVDLGTDVQNCCACGRSRGTGQRCCGETCITTPACGESGEFDDATCSCVGNARAARACHVGSTCRECVLVGESPVCLGAVSPDGQSCGDGGTCANWVCEGDACIPAELDC